jgi:hypothetical protein
MRLQCIPGIGGLLGVIHRLVGDTRKEERTTRRDDGREEGRWGDSKGKNLHLLMCVLLGGNGAGHEILVRSARRCAQRERKRSAMANRRRNLQFEVSEVIDTRELRMYGCCGLKQAADRRT